MTLDQIIQDKQLAHSQKKSEMMKSDFSNVLFESVEKAFSNNSQEVEVLVYETNISKQRNEEMFEAYKSGFVLNHSVGMYYIKLFLCINSDQPFNASEKEDWDKYYPMLLNPEQADKMGYFWAVVESKNVEGSAVVKGSNFLTPVLEMEVIDENTIRVKCAINVCNVLDSHNDVHIPGCWKKTIKEKNYDLMLQEHKMTFGNVIADSINDGLKVYTENIQIKDLMSKFKKNKNNGAGATTPNKEEPSNDTQKSVTPYGIGILY